jgi:hypothetical protein
MHTEHETPQPSTPHNSINMSLIEATLADMESLKPGEFPGYTKIASKHGVEHSTLSRRHRVACNCGVQQEKIQYTIRSGACTVHRSTYQARYSSYKACGTKFAAAIAGPTGRSYLSYQVPKKENRPL